VQRIERQLVVAGEGFAKGVERAGADIAEDDADRADRQLEHAISVLVMRLIVAAGAGRGSRYWRAHEWIDRSDGARRRVPFTTCSITSRLSMG
jgi:hypothetical protein